ncbi:hypothetical protein TcG_07263 [Trypanosoma cruzi]|nr:hypothetical protein TcG_07263 [Trypanosoma cruzi]
MMGDGAVPCGAPRVGALEEGVSLSMQTTALVLLRHAADQRTMRLGIDSRRISKITASGPTVTKALVWSTKTALRCSNWSGEEFPGKKQDGCGVNWDSMKFRMRVAGVRSMSLLGQLLSVTGRWGVAV